MKPKLSKPIQFGITAALGVCVAQGLFLVTMNVAPYSEFASSLISSVDWSFLGPLANIPYLGGFFRQWGSLFFGALIYAGIQLLEIAPLLLRGNRENLKHTITSVERETDKLKIKDDDHRHIKGLKREYNVFVVRLLERIEDAKLVAYAIDGFALFNHYPPVNAWGGLEWQGILINIAILVFVEVLLGVFLWTWNFKAHLISTTIEN